MLSIGIVAVASSFSLAARAEARAHRVAVACLLADEKMVELQLQSARRVGASEGDFGPAFPGYGWQANVTPTQTARLYVAELAVYYGDAGKAGGTRTPLIKIVTLLRI
jgi:hypothetical protein